MAIGWRGGQGPSEAALYASFCLEGMLTSSTPLRGGVDFFKKVLISAHRVGLGLPSYNPAINRFIYSHAHRVLPLVATADSPLRAGGEGPLLPVVHRFPPLMKARLLAQAAGTLCPPAVSREI